MKILKTVLATVVLLNVNLAFSQVNQEQLSIKAVKNYYGLSAAAVDIATLKSSFTADVEIVTPLLGEIERNLIEIKDVAKQALVALDNADLQSFLLVKIDSRRAVIFLSLSRLQLALLRSGELTEVRKDLVEKVVKKIQELNAELAAPGLLR